MATSFTIELQELEAVRLKLQALLQDHFLNPASALSSTTYHDNTASDMMQTAAAAGLKRANGNDGTSTFGLTNQGLDAAANLNHAHANVQRAIYGLIAEVNQKINDLHDRIQQTHQLYATTEANLHIDITQVQKGA